MSTLNADLVVRLSANLASTQDVGQGQYQPRLEKIIQLASGTGANQSDQLFIDTRTLAASGSEDLDLAGVLDNLFDNNMVMAEIVAIIVIADAANTNNVVIGAASATKWVGPFGAATHTIAIGPGGVFVIAGPNGNGIGAVGAGATDFLGVANSGAGTSVTYTIAILGRSA